MNELYWITVLGNISVVSVSVMVVLIIVWTVIAIGFIITSNCDSVDMEIRGHLKSVAKKALIPTIIFSLLSIFIPTSRELMMIYGIGGAIDYIQENPDVKKLPDTYIKILNKWADDKLKNDSIK